MYMGKPSIAVLGGEGFVGHNLLDFLEAHYECFSVGTQRSSFASKSQFFLGDPYKKPLNLPVDVVIHLIDNAVSQQEFQQNERQLIKNIFTSKLRHIIVFSSAVVYANPDSEYGKRKRALEKIFQEECQKRNVALTIFRLFNVYGAYQLPDRQGSLVANLFCNYFQGKTTQINDLEARRDFLYAGDLGLFVEYVLKEKKIGVFDLSSNHTQSLAELIKELEGILHQKVAIYDKQQAETLRNVPGQNPFLGEISLTPLREGLEKTAEFYREHLSEVLQVTSF
jgi:nucleoside-diphosphate-sugar epimerase